MADDRFFSSSREAYDERDRLNVLDEADNQKLKEDNKNFYSLIGNLPFIQKEYKVFFIYLIFIAFFALLISIPIILSSTEFKNPTPWDKTENHQKYIFNFVVTSQDDVENLRTCFIICGSLLIVFSLLLASYIISTHPRRSIIYSETRNQFDTILTAWNPVVQGGQLGVWGFWLPWLIWSIVPIFGLIYIFAGRYHIKDYKSRPDHQNIVVTGNGGVFPIFSSLGNGNWVNQQKALTSTGLAIGYGLTKDADNTNKIRPTAENFYAVGMGFDNAGNIMKSKKNNKDLFDPWSDYSDGASFNIGKDIAYGYYGVNPYLVAVGEGKDQIISTVYQDTPAWEGPSSAALFDVSANGVAYGLSGSNPCWMVVGENSDGLSPIKFGTLPGVWEDIDPLPGGATFSAEKVEFGVASGICYWVVTGKGSESSMYYAIDSPKSTWATVPDGPFALKGTNIRYVREKFWLATGIDISEEASIKYASSPIDGWTSIKGDFPSIAYDADDYIHGNDAAEYDATDRIFGVGSYPNLVISDIEDGIKWVSDEQPRMGTVYAIETNNPKYPLN